MSSPNEPPQVPPPPPPPEPRDIAWDEQEAERVEKGARLERIMLTIVLIVTIPIGLALLGLLGLYIACLVG